MENIESPKGAEIENERSQNENLDTSMEVTEVQPTFSEIERVVSEYSELNETEKKQKVEKYLQRAKRSRDAWRTKIQAHNGRPCLGKGCTLCIEKAAYKNGKLETTKLSEAKFSKYFSSEDQNGYIHPDFYPSIKFQPKHNHCKNICCVCTRFPYLHGSNKELLEPVHKRRDEPLSETCIKCKGVRFSMIPIRNSNTLFRLLI